MDNDIFAIIKEKLDLSKVIGEDEPLSGRGNTFKGEQHDSLIVTRKRDTGEWYYYWNSRGHAGDVFNWLKNVRGMDTKTALEYAAKKANVSLPDWTKKDTKQWLAQKVNEDVMTIASRVFHKWMLKDEAAMNYARERGLTDETIRKARLGFTGYATASETKEMLGEFAMHGIDPASPAAIAILGFQGDVHQWAMSQNIMHGTNNQDILNGYLPGFMGRTRLIFPHLYFGQVTYLSSRNLKRDGERLVSFNEPKSFNPRREFLGERQPYFSPEYSATAPHVAIAEGQFDILSLFQWGVNSVGVSGAHLPDDLMERLRKNHETIYFIKDNDAAGEMVVMGKDNTFPVAELLGPQAHIVKFPEFDRVDNEIGSLKDVNDLLKSYSRREIPLSVQKRAVWTRLNSADTVVIVASRYAANVQKSKMHSDKEKLNAMERAFQIISLMDRKTVTYKLRSLISALGMNTQEFNRKMKQTRGEREDESAAGKGHKIVETFGGFFPVDEDGEVGWLVDYLWDPVKKRAKFAYRDPQGQIGMATKLDIEGVRYFPEVDDNVRNGIIQFPSELGELKSTKELLSIKELFFRRSFILDNPLYYKLAAYWAQGTWVFDCFDELSYLKMEGGHDSGKSAIMLRIGNVCYRTLTTSGLGTAASLKYMQHIYKGTVMLDEIPDNLDEFDERVTMLNIGAMKKQAWITNAMPTKMPDGSTKPVVQAYNVYGPKIVTMYGKFPQQATESRFLVFKTFRKTLSELKKKNVPRRLNDQWYADALAIRNMDITWRLKNWEKRIQPSDDLEDEQVSTRVNQVTVGIKHLVKDDAEALREVDLVVRNMYQEQQEEQMMSTEARVLDAIVAVLEDETISYLGLVKEANLALFGKAKYIRYPDLTRVVNWIIDEMNSGEKVSLELRDSSEDDGEDIGGKRKKKKYGVTAKTVGAICRNAFRLARHRLGRGYVVILESSAQPEVAQERIEMLKVKYGASNFVNEEIEQKEEPIIDVLSEDEQRALL